MSENLCLIDSDCVKKVIGWSLLRWNRQSPQGLFSIPPIPPQGLFSNPPTFHLLSTHLTIPCLKMGQSLEIRIWLEILTVCWEFARSELIFIAILFGHTSPPRCHCHIGGTRPTFMEGDPLRWDRLSPRRGLFLKQTRPSTDRRLESEPASRA